MAMIKLYSLMTVISVLVRQFVLPNPFECFGEKATLINWIAEPIIQIVAYGIVGLFYVKGSAPALGVSCGVCTHYRYPVGIGYILVCLVVDIDTRCCCDCIDRRRILAKRKIYEVVK